MAKHATKSIFLISAYQWIYFSGIWAGEEATGFQLGGSKAAPNKDPGTPPFQIKSMQRLLFQNAYIV